MGAAVGTAIYLLIKGNFTTYLIVTISILGLGLISSDAYAKYSGKKDPHEVIIDEIACVPIIYLFVPFSIINLLVGFVLCRLFDIVKPFPIRDSERLPGGYGIMVDDILAAIFTNIVLHLLLCSQILFSFAGR